MKKNDLILAAAIILTAAAILAFQFFSQSDGEHRVEVTVDGEPIKLTPIEYNILLLLVKNAGKVFSIDEIYEQIWNEEAIGADNTVAVHIRHIREKIEINPREPKYLKVVWGVGYKIEKQ